MRQDALSFSCCHVILVENRGKKKKKKSEDRRFAFNLATCQSGTLAMLSSKVNSPLTHKSTWMMTDMAPRGL